MRGATMRRRRVIRGWWHRRFLATENGEQTNDESTTPRAQVRRRHRDVLPVPFSENQVSPCDGDLIPIGPVGLWGSQEVYLVDSVCRHGPPRRGKPMVTLLSDETRKLDGRIDKADEQ
ncbi:MAG: hypothetical protein ACYCPT_11340 [Acidimicrobiales bacterium]